MLIIPANWNKWFTSQQCGRYLCACELDKKNIYTLAKSATPDYERLYEVEIDYYRETEKSFTHSHVIYTLRVNWVELMIYIQWLIADENQNGRHSIVWWFGNYSNVSEKKPAKFKSPKWLHHMMKYYSQLLGFSIRAKSMYLITGAFNLYEIWCGHFSMQLIFVNILDVFLNHSKNIFTHFSWICGIATHLVCI